MAGWIDGLMDNLRDGCWMENIMMVIGWIDGLILDGSMIDEWMDDYLMTGLIDGWMDNLTDECWMKDIMMVIG